MVDVSSMTTITILSSYTCVLVSRYVERFVQPGESVSDACKLHLSKKPVFLPRGIRSYKKSPFAKTQVERSRQLVKAKESSNSEDHSEKSKSASKE